MTQNDQGFAFFSIPRWKKITTTMTGLVVVLEIFSSIIFQCLCGCLCLAGGDPIGLVIPAVPITRPATPFTPQSVFGWGGSRNLTRYIFTPRYFIRSFLGTRPTE